MEIPSTLRHIVITGASSGLGAALARHYAAPGRQLSLTGRNSERLEKISAECRKRGGEVTSSLVDVTQVDAMEAWLLARDAAFPIDLLIANAGISGGTGGLGSGIFGESPAQTRAIFSVNIDGVLNSVLPILEPMAHRKSGQIAIISSLAGLRGLPSAPAYSASKGAVRAWGEALRGWMKRYEVSVNVVCPGYIATPLTEKNKFPMPFLMTPEKAAAIIARGLARDRPRIAFPLALYLPTLIASMLPLRLTDPLFARLPGKE